MGEPITKIEMNEIENYKCLASGTGLGVKAQNAVNDYCNRLNKTSSEAFGKGDNSTAHAVIDTLSLEARKIDDAMKDVDILIDSLLEIVKKDIIDKEDLIVKNISEVSF